MADETPVNEQGIPLEHALTLDEVAKIQAEQRAPLEVLLKEVEVSKLNLQANDVLVVKMKGMDLDHDLITSLQKHFRKVFPANKVLVFSLTEDATMDLEVVNAAILAEPPPPAPVNYCAGCDCGKKEAAETRQTIDWPANKGSHAIMDMAPEKVPEAPVTPKPEPYRISAGQLVKAIEAGHAVEGENGAIVGYIGGGYYLVRFDSVGVIKMNGLGLQEQKGETK